MSQIEYVDHLDTASLSEQTKHLGIGFLISMAMAKWHGRRDAVAVKPVDAATDARTKRHLAREKHYMSDIGMAVDF